LCHFKDRHKGIKKEGIKPSVFLIRESSIPKKVQKSPRIAIKARKTKVI
jgi:hypothetical protein